ncbi:hypothetical protein BGZ63DRAFT_7641 [Mariannaea sp. PMI_226]|nr:hypothetical protein BGZ63DRAFT_7641 [Mariannaea sp. PMI_226]
MCIYIYTVFGCGHVVWGRRIQRCSIAKSDKRSTGCAKRQPHAHRPRKFVRKCEKCLNLHTTLIKIKAGIAECKATLQLACLMDGTEKGRVDAKGEGDEKTHNKVSRNVHNTG